MHLIVRDLLERRLPAYRIVSAESGEQALELYARLRPAVVLMDISLPRMDGIETARRLRARWPDARIVMHSGHAEAVYRDAAADAGACAFIDKDRTFEELVPTLSACLPVIPESGA